MFGQITDLPYLGSYTDALFHYDSIVPIRGSDNLRPICRTPNGRRKKQYQIRVNSYDDPSVMCQLYSTDVLTFRSNGDVIFHNGGYPTSTTHGFANAILYYDGVSFGTRQNRTEITVGGKAYIIEPYQYFTIRKNSDGKYEAVDPKPQYEYYVKRDALAAYRAPLLPFQKHCLAMAKLADPKQYSDSDRMTLQLTGVVTRNYSAMADPTMENWDNVLRQVLYAACDHQYAGAGYMEYTFNPELIKRFITDTVKYRFAHEVFERREVDRRTFNGNEKFITWGGRADADT